MTSIVHDHLIVKSTDVLGTDLASAGDLPGTATPGHEDIPLAMTEDTTYYIKVAVRGAKDVPAASDSLPTLH